MLSIDLKTSVMNKWQWFLCLFAEEYLKLENWIMYQQFSPQDILYFIVNFFLNGYWR